MTSPGRKRCCLWKEGRARDVQRAFIVDVLKPKKLTKEVLRTGDGGDFQRYFQAFLTQHVISHEKTCAYTPQYNGVTERDSKR